MANVGFITYNLEDFAAGCLNRVAEAIAPHRLKAYPVLSQAAGGIIEFEYRPSRLQGSFFSLKSEKNTPEGLMWTVNWGAAWACARENDIVALFGLQGGTALAGAFFAKLLGKRLISVNQTLPPEAEWKRRRWVRMLKKWILRQCRAHIAQTPVTYDTLKEVYGIPREACVFAPFEAGFSLYRERTKLIETGRSEFRSAYGWAENIPVFLFVGSLLRFKGVETLIEAAALMKEENFKVVFFGHEVNQAGEPKIADYQAKAGNLGVAGKIDFAGRVGIPELAQAYQAADALLLPTQKDCWPKVLVEAASAGLPLVTTTSCGAAGSLAEDGVTGYVIPPADPRSLAGAMRQLLDADKRRIFGAAARRFVFDFCDPEKEAAGYAKAVQLVLKEDFRDDN